MVIVDRNVDCDVQHLAFVDRPRDERDERQRPERHAHVLLMLRDRCAGLADRSVAEAVVGVLGVEPRRGVGGDLHPLLPVRRRPAMQEPGVRGVDRALEALQAVRALPLLDDRTLLRGHREPVVLRERGLLLRRTQVHPDHVPDLLDRERPRAQPVLVRRVAGLGRHLEARAVDAKLPPVVDASQAALFVAAERKRRQTVRAGRIDEADLPVGVAEGHEVLAEQPDADRRPVALRDLFGQERRDPIASHHRAHRCPRSDGCQERALSFGQHGVSLSRRQAPVFRPRARARGRRSRRLGQLQTETYPFLDVAQDQLWRIPARWIADVAASARGVDAHAGVPACSSVVYNEGMPIGVPRRRASIRQLSLRPRPTRRRRPTNRCEKPARA